MVVGLCYLSSSSPTFDVDVESDLAVLVYVCVCDGQLMPTSVILRSCQIPQRLTQRHSEAVH